MSTGQIVLIVDQQLPHSLWPVGRVMQVISGVDGRIWTVEVKVGNKVYIRPVARLIPLPEVKDEGEGKEENEAHDRSPSVEFEPNSEAAVENSHSLHN